MNLWMCGWMDGFVDGWMCGCVDGWKVWRDGLIFG